MAAEDLWTGRKVSFEREATLDHLVYLLGLLPVAQIPEEDDGVVIVVRSRYEFCWL